MQGKEDLIKSEIKIFFTNDIIISVIIHRFGQLFMNISRPCYTVLKICFLLSCYYYNIACDTMQMVKFS